MAAYIDADGADERVCRGHVEQLFEQARLANAGVAHHDQLEAGVGRFGLFLERASLVAV